ncbi:MAG TPA: tRNA guanosine(34) transglycosylase Tgt [Patescibacteria group bacterium]|nr:tRNA guanosine(34) transglycosylase Tgt [Patescibacteria group bacterium]
MKKNFRYRSGSLPLPVFFPDATRAIVKSIDTTDLKSTKTPGILVNTYHLFKDLGEERIKEMKGIGKFMGWDGAIISDSGGFQIGSLIKKDPKLGRVTDMGATFHPKGEKTVQLTPEKSVRFQMELGADMIVVLDDFTDPKAGLKKAKESVERTILWAKRSKAEFEKICKEKNLTVKNRPYILGVVQGGRFPDLRKYCAEELVKIGFDGFGYGGDERKDDKSLNYEILEVIAKATPKDYFLYGLGVGKPEDIVKLVKMGYNIFDCVLPTRDARHKRLYVYNFDSIKEINLNKKNFYSYYTPDKKENLKDNGPVSRACDCITCKNYSKAYLAHLFAIGDFTAGRLATIHNLRFYSILMEKLRTKNV